MRAMPGPHVAWREIDGETVLVDLQRSLMVAVNRPGGLVWRAVQEGADLEATARALRPGSPGDGLRVVLEFLSELEERGLVVVEGLSGNQDASLPSATDPGDDAVPRILWREDLRSFVQQTASCGRLPTQGGQCQVFPRT